MIDPTIFASIEQTARALCEKLGVDAPVRVAELPDGSVVIKATSSDPQLLIGERGQTLAELEYLIKRIVRKKTGEMTQVSFDINEYKEKKEASLREAAREAANDAALFKQPKELPAMTPAERRIVHMELALREDVVSESVGEGEHRRVVVRPKSF